MYMATLTFPAQHTLMELLRKKHVMTHCATVQTESYEDIVSLFQHYETYRLGEVFKSFPRVRPIFDLVLMESTKTVAILFALCSHKECLCLFKHASHMTWCRLDIPRLQEKLRQAKHVKRVYTPMCFLWVFM